MREGDTASQDKNFSEMWMLKLRVLMLYKVYFFFIKSRILLKLLPEGSLG